jgi:hypothetical protein
LAYFGSVSTISGWAEASAKGAGGVSFEDDEEFMLCKAKAVIRNRIPSRCSGVVLILQILYKQILCRQRHLDHCKPDAILEFSGA